MIIGTGNTTLAIRIEFNQPVDPFTVVSGIRLMRNNVIGGKKISPLYDAIDLTNTCTNKGDLSSDPVGSKVAFVGGNNSNTCYGFQIENGSINYRKVIIYDPSLQSINALLDIDEDGIVSTEEANSNPNIVLLISEGVASQRGQFLDIGKYASTTIKLK